MGDQPMMESSMTNIPMDAEQAPQDPVKTMEMEGAMGLDSMEDHSMGEQSQIQPSIGDNPTEATAEPQDSTNAVDEKAEVTEDHPMKEHVIKSGSIVEPSTDEDQKAQKL